MQMNERVNASDAASASMVANSAVSEALQAPYFIAEAECWDAEGNLRWREVFRNTVMTEGKTLALNVLFGATAKVSNWYALPISSVSYSAINPGDTAAQINGTNGWKEAGPSNAPSYSQATRPALTFAAASGTAIATSAASTFSITSTGTIKGIACVTASAKDATTGTLYSAGLFATEDRSLLNGDTLNVNLTQNLT